MSTRTIFNSYHRNLLKRAEGGNRSAAIKAHCLECMCGVRKEVEECTAPKCPLYQFRNTAAVTAHRARRGLAPEPEEEGLDPSSATATMSWPSPGG